MKKRTQTIIRILLQLVLIFFIYQETGIFTAIFVTLMSVRNELDDKIRSNTKESRSLLSNNVEELFNAIDKNKK